MTNVRIESGIDYQYAYIDISFDVLEIDNIHSDQKLKLSTTGHRDALLIQIF